MEIKSAIEVGHVFKLGTKYSKSLQASFLDEQGESRTIIMGCYGIGVTRIIAACIEQNFDEHGIIWPKEIAPFAVAVMAQNPLNESLVKTAAKIYEQLKEGGVEVIYDDRDIRAGMKFKDADLSGIPLQVIVGEKTLARQMVEVKIRKTGERRELPIAEAASGIRDILKDI